MIPKDSDNTPDGDWDDPEELGWDEFEWERYLRFQDDVVLRYIGLYLQAAEREDRLDHVARQMGWDAQEEAQPLLSTELDESDDEDEEDEEGDDPYTLQRNPVFIAATALFHLLQSDWERMAREGTNLPVSLALKHQGALSRCERNAILGLQSLDLGDYTLAISLFKRAMRDLNTAMSAWSGLVFQNGGPLQSWRKEAMPRLFDLREVLLRVIRECRDEIVRHPGQSDEDDGERRS